MAKTLRWQLRINRAGWLSGSVLSAVKHELASSTNPYPLMDSSLREAKTGLQCCLGFGMRKAGVLAKSLISFGLPSDVVRNWPATVDEYLVAALRALEDIDVAAVNDSGKLSARTREASLVRKFATVGIALTFYGSSLPAIKKAQKAYGKRQKELSV